MAHYPHLTFEPHNERDWFAALAALARYLRTPDGCPWDRDQSAPDFARHLQGEVEELREALNGADARAVEEEFGDTLFTLLATAAAAEEAGDFNLERALQAIHDKMIRRHGHVFGDEKAETPEDAIRVWNKAKEAERKQP